MWSALDGERRESRDGEDKPCVTTEPWSRLGGAILLGKLAAAPGTESWLKSGPAPRERLARSELTDGSALESPSETSSGPSEYDICVEGSRPALLELADALKDESRLAAAVGPTMVERGERIESVLDRSDAPPPSVVCSVGAAAKRSPASSVLDARLPAPVRRDDDTAPSDSLSPPRKNESSSSAWTAPFGDAWA